MHETMKFHYQYNHETCSERSKNLAFCTK